MQKPGKREEQIMQVVWPLKEAFIKDLYEWFYWMSIKIDRYYKLFNQCFLEVQKRRQEALKLL